MKALLCHEPGPELARELRGLAATGLDIVCVGDDDEKGLAAALATAEVIWHILKPLTAGHIDAAPGLRLIQKIGVGVNTIDLDAARRRNIPVCNMPGTNTRAVAEMTLLLMLGALRRISMLDAGLRRGGAWTPSPAVQEGFGEIHGRSIGLVGYGAIPALLTPILQAMGASVCYWTRAPKAAAAAQWKPLEELLAGSDIVSLHVPLTPETQNLIDADALAAMKPGAILVNTARGGLVDEAALISALDSGRLAAAGLDVFAIEPLPAQSPLTAMPNVVISPHVAWLTRETWRRSIAVAVENCRRLAAGSELLYRVV
jgi:phosphoglycerate dehydrogenase-like enzyme